jgi:hypothetical protein
MSFLSEIRKWQSTAELRSSTGATGATVELVSCEKSSPVANVSTPLDEVAQKQVLGYTSTREFCWPNGPAMNQQEIQVLIARQLWFEQRGFSGVDAERYADSLVERDRDRDRRVYCLECRNLLGREKEWRCGNNRRAGMPFELASNFVTQLQWCPGFIGVVGVRDENV